MATTTPVSLHHHFANLSDPRVERARRHELLDIIAIAVCAIISGAESWTAIVAGIMTTWPKSFEQATLKMCRPWGYFQ